MSAVSVVDAAVAVEEIAARAVRTASGASAANGVVAAAVVVAAGGAGDRVGLNRSLPKPRTR